MNFSNEAVEVRFEGEMVALYMKITTVRKDKMEFEFI